MWRQSWTVLDDVVLGADGVDVLKCKSHVSKTTRKNLDVEAKEIVDGNDEADTYAKLGAGMDDMERCRAQALAEAGDKVQGALRLIATFVAHAQIEGTWTDTTPGPSNAESKIGSDSVLVGRPAGRRVPDKPHEEPLEPTDAGGVRCRLCQGEASATRARAFRFSECAGVAAAKVAGPVAPGHSATLNRHPLIK